MPQLTSPFLDIKYGWNEGEGGWKAGMDSILLKFSYLLDNNVDAIVSSVPQPAVNGTAYFNTTDNLIYFVVAGTYQITPIPKWFTFKLRADGSLYQFTGSTTVLLPSNAALGGRVTTLETTVGTLGTAAFESKDSFTSSSFLSNTADVAKGAALVGRGLQVLSRVSLLRTLKKTAPSAHALCLGFYGEADKGGGLFWRDDLDTTSVDNDYTVFVNPNDGARWKRVPSSTPNVQQAGARGDGATNDNAAINKFLAANTSCYFPGTANGYRTSANLVVPNSGSSIFGDGPSSFINISTMAASIFVVTAVSDVEFRNISAIDYTPPGTIAQNYWFIDAIPTSKIRILNCHTFNIHSGVRMGVTGTSGGGANSRIQGCNFNRIGAGTGIGVQHNGDAEIREVLDCVIGGPGSGANGAVNGFSGVHITGGTAIVLHNLELAGCGTPILVQPPATKQVAHTKVGKVWCDSSSNVGMWLDGSAGRIINFSTDECWFSSNGVGIKISGYVHDAIIMQAEVYQNRSDGIVVDSNADSLGLVIGGGTRVAGNTGSGVSIGQNVSAFRITNSNIGSSSHFGGNANGIYLNGGNDNYDISHNSIYGNTGSQIFGHTAGTASKVVKSNIGYTTNVDAYIPGLTTDASGLVTVTHNMGRVPNGFMAGVFASTDARALHAQVVSLATNTAVLRILANNTALASTSINMYIQAFY